MPKDKWVGQERKGSTERRGRRRKAWGKKEDRSQARLFPYSYLVFWTQCCYIISSDLHPMIPIVIIANRCRVYLAAGTDLNT